MHVAVPGQMTLTPISHLLGMHHRFEVCFEGIKRVVVERRMGRHV
jgi:hypothetical protein